MSPTSALPMMLSPGSSLLLVESSLQHLPWPFHSSSAQPYPLVVDDLTEEAHIISQACDSSVLTQPSSYRPLSSHHIHFLVFSAPLNVSRFNALCLHFFSPDSLTLICWLYAPPPKTSKVARDFLSTKRKPFLSSHLSASVLFMSFFKSSLLTRSPWFLRFFSMSLAPLCSLCICLTVDSLLDSGLS